MNHSVDYDKQFDILRIREVGNGNFDYYGETQENGLITEFRDTNTNELKGFEIHDFMKQIGINQTYTEVYNKAIDDFVNTLLNWKTDDEKYRTFEDVCYEITKKLKNQQGG